MKTIKQNWPIDPPKLMRELNRRGLTPAQASQELGCSSSWLKNHLKSGVTTLQAIKALESRYNLPYDAYKMEIPEESIMEDMEIPEAPIPGQLVFGMPEDLSANKLYQIFYAAMRKALQDDREESTKKEADA